MAGKITYIPANYNKETRMPGSNFKRRRVAGYARVSTDDEEQLTSYEAQVDYYTTKIKNNPEWDFVDVYTDEGISGTNTKHREGFNRMIADALAGKIDLIITKSVSRFARNTVDSLITIRKLKEKHVEVYFEKENIFTFDGKGEVLLTIMASLAQEESRSISENITWGQRKRFSDGKVCMPYSRFLGYDKGPEKDSPPVINKEQAKQVQLIYRLFLNGMTPAGIASELEKRNIPSPSGKQKWCISTIDSILKNEKYKGDALLQKTFTVDFLSKKMKLNEGEVPQYYVTESHPAIILPEEWELVQIEIMRRKQLSKRYSGTNVLASRIVCGNCGGFYGRKVWHSTDIYKHYIWRCNEKFNGNKCDTPTLKEEDVKQKFIAAYNQMLSDKKTVVDDLEIIKSIAGDTTDIDIKIETITNKIDDYDNQMMDMVKCNSTEILPQADFILAYDAIELKRRKAAEKRTELLQQREAKKSKVKLISRFIHQIISRKEYLSEWDDTIWVTNIDRAIIQSNGDFVFRFIGGYEVTIRNE